MPKLAVDEEDIIFDWLHHSLKWDLSDQFLICDSGENDLGDQTQVIIDRRLINNW